VLVFAFAPALASLPGWLLAEATSPLNMQDPVVSSFVLVRGVLGLLNAFYAGLVPGVLAGAIEGALVCAWVLSGGAISTRRQRALMGAITGALAASLMVLLVMGVELLGGRPRAWAADAVAFEAVSGILCGLIAAPTAVRFLREARYPGGTSVSASQK
jgi:hypothetical protein